MLKELPVPPAFTNTMDDILWEGWINYVHANTDDEYATYSDFVEFAVADLTIRLSSSFTSTEVYERWREAVVSILMGEDRCQAGHWSCRIATLHRAVEQVSFALGDPFGILPGELIDLYNSLLEIETA